MLLISYHLFSSTRFSCPHHPFPSCWVSNRLHLMSHFFDFLHLCSALSGPTTTLLSLFTNLTYPYPYPHLASCPSCLSAPIPTLSFPHCLPLLFWLMHGLRKTLLRQCNGWKSKHTFLLQRICPCSTHSTSQAWVLHIHQYICSLKLEIWNLNCTLSNGTKMLPWWNNRRKDQC